MLLGAAGAGGLDLAACSGLAAIAEAAYPLGDPSQYPTWITGRLSDHTGLNITYIREMAALSGASVGGIAELPAAADGGWPAGVYAALLGGASVALAAVAAGAWYTRRRRL